MFFTIPGPKMKAAALRMFFCHLRVRSYVNCASLFCPLDRKIWKNTYIYPPIEPPLEEIRTEVVKSRQKIRIKTSGVNGYVSASSTCDPIDQNAS